MIHHLNLANTSRKKCSYDVIDFQSFGQSLRFGASRLSLWVSWCGIWGVAFATEVVFATAGTPALGSVSDAFGTGTAGTLAAGIAAAVVSVPPGGSSTAASAGVSAAGVAVVVSAGGNLNCQQL